MGNRNITDFFNTDIPNYAAYDNRRKISNFCDGQKVSMRKILYTLMEKYPGTEKIKTDTVTNICAAFTNYIHGAANLGGVCDTMAQSFVGANNYPLIEGNSSGFGTRINPQCAASRYTKIALSPLAESLFNENDSEILEKQFFEGSYIEPKFFIPIFPVLFLNGSHGVSTGFSQDIYPRNPKEIIKYIQAKLNNENYKGDLLPWFKNFKGSVQVNKETNSVECWGYVVKNSMTSYTISEIPIDTTYQKYIEILDKLCDSGIIVDYEDNCDTKTDTISFNIKTTREFTKKYDSDYALYNVLKLIKSLPENYNCIDENNKVKEYKNVFEILDDYIKIRLTYYDIRKTYLLNKYKDRINFLNSKYEFCNGVINKTITISNVKKDDIIKQLEAFDKIIKVDNSYSYLLNLPMHSLSYETLKSLKDEIKEIKLKYKELKDQSLKDIWESELKTLSNKF